jgi:hypothetical protein
MPIERHILLTTNIGVKAGALVKENFLLLRISATKRPTDGFIL